MTREELKDCDGFNVQIQANGVDAFAMLSSSDPSTAFIIPSDPKPGWSPVGSYTLSDADVATMSHNGDRNLFSLINLQRDL